MADTLLGQQDRVAAIRQHLAMKPHDSATEVIAALSRLGQTASPALVQQVKQEMAIAESPREERAEPAATKVASPATSESVSSSDLAAAEQFVARVGGIARARNALETWATSHPAS